MGSSEQNDRSDCILTDSTGCQVTNSGSAVDITRNVSLLSAVMMVIGTMIGSGIFMTPNGIVKVVPSFLNTLIIWLVCGAIAFFASLCYAELGIRYPKCGGEFEYLKHAYHPSFSFSFLMTSYFLIKPVQTAILTLFFVENILNICYVDAFKLPYWSTRFISSLVMIIICIVNCYSNKLSLKINNALTFSKFICLAVIFGVGIYHLAIGHTENILNATVVYGTITPAGFSVAIYSGMWAYEGWNETAYMMEEMKNPEKNIKRTLFISLFTVTFGYLLANFSYLVILGVAGIISSSSVAVDAVRPYLGSVSILISILVSLSALGSGNATFFCGGRIYFDGARCGHLPAIICAIHKKRRTMVVSYVTQAFLTIMFILFAKNIGSLLIYFSNAMWVYYGLTIFGIVIVRYRYKNEESKFKIPLVIPLLMTCIAIALVSLSFYDSPLETGVSFIIILGTMPLYFLLVFKDKAFMVSLNEKFKRLSNILVVTFNLEIPRLDQAHTG